MRKKNRNEHGFTGSGLDFSLVDIALDTWVEYAKMIPNKIAFQWDVYRSLVAHIAVCTA